MLGPGAAPGRAFVAFRGWVPCRSKADYHPRLAGFQDRKTPSYRRPIHTKVPRGTRL